MSRLLRLDSPYSTLRFRNNNRDIYESMNTKQNKRKDGSKTTKNLLNNRIKKRLEASSKAVKIEKPLDKIIHSKKVDTVLSLNHNIK